jgi:tetratricopeptide (TPR) repeat protein
VSQGINLKLSQVGILLATVMVAGGGFLAPRAIADGIPGVTFGTETGAEPPGPTAPTPTTDVDNAAYTQAMLIGYAAAEQNDYQTALINFRRALAARPGDRYALAAIANMEAYIAQQRQEALRQQRLGALRERLEAAVEARDWACAASTVDEMITLVPEDSLQRSRLVTYRGEVSVFVDSRSDIEQWSTVCPG